MSDSSFEFKVVRIRKRAGEDAFKAELEKQGSDGWEALHCETAGRDRVAYLQRPKATPKKASKKAAPKKAKKKKAAPKS